MTVSLIGISPSKMFDEGANLAWSNHTTGLPVTDQLYTARGSQSVATTTRLVTESAFNLNNFRSTLKLENIGYGERSTKYRMRVLWTSDITPFYGYNQDDEDRSSSCSFPTYLRMSQFTIDELPLRKAYVRLHDSNDIQLINEMISTLKVIVPSKVDVWSKSGESGI